MDLQHYRNSSVCFTTNLLNEIIDLNKYKALDDRYIVSNICKNTNLKYEFAENICNVFYKSFSVSINFNERLFKSITCFIDLNLFNLEGQRKFIKLIEDLLTNKNINFNGNYLKNILNSVLNNTVIEIKDNNVEFNFYINKIINDAREFIFIMISNL